MQNLRYSKGVRRRLDRFTTEDTPAVNSFAEQLELALNAFLAVGAADDASNQHQLTITSISIGHHNEYQMTQHARFLNDS